MVNQLSKSMREAAKEEKKHTISAESFHQRISAITVMVDGGWSKRSHALVQCKERSSSHFWETH